MGQDPSAIREEIEETRARMGERADALAYKADVPARTKQAVTDKKDQLMSAVSGRTPSSGQVKGKARQGKGLAEDNPLGMAIGAAALGFLAGMLVPASRLEDESIGPLADQAKDQARELGSEAVDRGKQVAGQAAEAARDAARETGQEQAGELGDSAREHADTVRQSADPSR